MEVSPPFSEVIPGLEDVQLRYFGKPSQFRTNPHDTTSPRIIWEPIESIGSVKSFKACFISNLTWKVVQDFQYPESIEEIRFDGYISRYNFDQLVVPLVNLRYLDIHLSSLEHLNFFNPLIQLNNLECLEITSINYTYVHATRANMGFVIENAIELLNIYFPSLSYLAVSVPALYTKEDEWTQAIVKSLIRHRATLRYLNVESPYPVLQDSLGRVLKDPATAKNFEEGLNHNSGLLDQITLISFHYYALHKTSSTEFWRHFLLQQEKLEYCQFWCDSPFKAASPKVIRNNAASLHTIALNNFNVSNDPDGTKHRLNCLSFRNCVNLKTIYLKGTASPQCGSIETDEASTNNNNKYSSDFENFELLPTSLEKVKICNILMSTEDTKFIITQLPNLISLHLEKIGEQGVLGLELEDLNKLVEENRLERIEIICGINRRSFEHSPGDGGYQTIAKILFKKQPRVWFRGVRNEEGGFDIFNEDDDEEDHEEDDESEPGSVTNIHINTNSEDEDTLSELPKRLPFQNQSRSNPTRSSIATSSRSRRQKPTSSIPSSLFQERPSIVNGLVDSEEANVIDFVRTFRS